MNRFSGARSPGCVASPCFSTAPSALHPPDNGSCPLAGAKETLFCETFLLPGLGRFLSSRAEQADVARQRGLDYLVVEVAGIEVAGEVVGTSSKGSNDMTKASAICFSASILS